GWHADQRLRKRRKGNGLARWVDAETLAYIGRRVVARIARLRGLDGARSPGFDRDRATVHRADDRCRRREGHGEPRGGRCAYGERRRAVRLVGKGAKGN